MLVLAGGRVLTYVSFTGIAEVVRCAEAVDVIALPVDFMSQWGGHDRTVQLAFSKIDIPTIDAGIGALARFFGWHG